MEMYEEEKKYLDFTLKAIDEEIDKSKKEIRNLEEASRKLSYEDKKRGSHFQLNNNIEINGKNIDNLQKARPTPYFGRIDFTLEDNDYNQTIYIGRIGINHDNEIIVNDWRAPICSVYYDSELGDTEYEAYGTEYKINLKLKRQINIKNSELIDVQDASLIVNDELLKPYLSLNADNKMKIIVASIQKEQNNIIRKPNDINLIVQGVAGSGKTSVALHRIAYLIYNMSSKLSSNNFLILGPNDYFLNYISSILPELETSPVNQETLVNFLNNYVNGNFIVKEKKFSGINDNELEIYKKVEKFKTSLDYKKILDCFLDEYIKNGIVKDDFIIDGNVIYSKEKVNNILFSIVKNVPNFTKVNNYFKSKFKENIDDIIDKVQKKYRNIYLNLPFDNPDRKKYVEDSNNLSKMIKKDGLKLLDRYLKNLNKSPLEIYLSFITNIDKYDSQLSKKEKLYLQKVSLSTLNKKNICFEDIPALMHIKYRITGEKVDYKYIVIDEAQDYGLFHFYALKEITDNCKFSIYGDLAQSVYSYRSINNWEEVSKEIFNDDCEMLYLNKSYRTTIEITENANNVLRQLNLKIANPVIRHGANVIFNEGVDNLNFKINTIKKWMNSGYQTSAIICKTDKEVQKVVKSLNANGLIVNSLTSNDKEYNGKIFVLTSAASKGLEFDTVIINDASDNVYSIDSDVDMHLLYVASTRALHEQVILYDKQITAVYAQMLNNDVKVKTKKIR